MKYNQKDLDFTSKRILLIKKKIRHHREIILSNSLHKEDISIHSKLIKNLTDFLSNLQAIELSQKQQLKQQYLF